MMHLIEVWEQTTGSVRRVGEMVCEIATSGRARGAFRYSQEFLLRKDSYPLDPVSLPLAPQAYNIDHPGVFSIFQDSLPDDWGRKLLVRKHNLQRKETNLPNLLLALASSGLGALLFSPGGQPRPYAAETSIFALSTLLTTAVMYDQGDEIDDDELTLLFGAGSSPGGARPKALVYDDKEGIHYLAKFPSTKDRVDVVRIEAATMSLAAKAGLQVPRTRLVEYVDESALLVERFDILPPGRRHMISLQTLLRAEGYYQTRYIEVLEVVRKYSSDPYVDSERLYRQMVFNAIIENTDDHLKNFWMVYSFSEGFRLSPAFDLVPNIGRNLEHVLFFDLGGIYPGRTKLEKLGKSWGVSNAERIVDEVYAAVKLWKDEYAAFGVVEKDIDRFLTIDTNLVS